MNKLTNFLDSVSKPRFEEDFVDRLNYRVTSYLFLAAAITLTTQVYVSGNPVQCWNPAQFAKGWEEYVHDYCLVENTYWLPMNDQIPTDTRHRDEKQLPYYQWVGFLLALQALMFYIPHVFWRMLNWLSGVQVRAVITMASNPGKLESSDAIDKTVTMVANHLKAAFKIVEKDALSTSSNPFAWLARFTSAIFGTYITCTYLFTKVLFIINCIVQFALLSTFLGTSSHAWGYDMFQHWRAGNDWSTTGYFPRVTLCDFEVRQLGNLHRWTVQCVLIQNMLNEKIYLFLWWWILFLTVVTVINFIYWIYICLVPTTRRNFLEKMLNAHSIFIETPNEKAVFDRFESQMIGSDGALVLRLMTSNAGELISSAVVAKLWNDTKENLLNGIHYDARQHRY